MEFLGSLGLVVSKAFRNGLKVHKGMGDCFNGPLRDGTPGRMSWQRGILTKKGSLPLWFCLDTRNFELLPGYQKSGALSAVS